MGLGVTGIRRNGLLQHDDGVAVLPCEHVGDPDVYHGANVFGSLGEGVLPKAEIGLIDGIATNRQ